MSSTQLFAFFYISLSDDLMSEKMTAYLAKY